MNLEIRQGLSLLAAVALVVSGGLVFWDGWATARSYLLGSATAFLLLWSWMTLSTRLFRATPPKGVGWLIMGRYALIALIFYGIIRTPAMSWGWYVLGLTGLIIALIPLLRGPRAPGEKPD
jgi:hypothetical protein